MSATVRLHPIRTGELLAPPQLLERVPGPFGTPRALGIGVPKSQYLWIPVPAFLIEHPSEGPVLIDTGMPALAASDMAAALSPTAKRLHEVRMRAEDGIAEQLRARGVDPAAIATVLMTHLHFDHSAGMPEIPNATFAASAAEFKGADGSAPARLLAGYNRAHYAGRPRRVLDFAGSKAWEGFRHSLDVFGDGSVRALSTPGHTAGHVSYAVATGAGPVLIVGDLAYTRSAIFGDAEPGLRAKPKLLRDSLAQLRGHARAHGDTVVIPGHDPTVWAGLNPVYG